MDLIQGMRAFVAVVDGGSFVRAADQLSMSKSAVTAHIGDLETRLAVRLLQRTTRRLSLTDDGAAYLEHCRRVLQDIDETIGALSHGRTTPRGRLHVDALTAIGVQYIVPALPRFTEQYPEVEVVLTLNDQVVDLIAQNVDVAVRAGSLQDASFVARRVFESPYVICAAPSYLERFGVPKTPDDLDRHQCLGMYFMSVGKVVPWIFERDGKRQEWQPNSRISVSSTEALIPTMVAGTGIGYLVECFLGHPLSANQLVPILTDWVRKDRLPISVVYPHNRHLSAKTRAFVEFVAGLFPRARHPHGASTVRS
ncbi:MAG: LysR family transcriptional regulator [Betaproteobacteria bacterium]|nr:LysR family transcriptional regulator [Betaproteobacteria bacterium]